MEIDAIFRFANILALAGWLALAVSPLLPRWSDRIAGLAIPCVLSAVYAGLILAFWSRADGGFGSLEDVMRLLSTPQLVLAGWLHYLAFDLLVGAWEVRTARREGMTFWLVLPCLALTFLFGPAGFFAFIALRAARAGSPIIRPREAS